MGRTSPADTAHHEPPKPRLRGRIHQVAAFVTVPAAIVLFVVARGPAVHLAVAVYGLTLVNMFSTSALYHRLQWSDRVRRRMQSLDHSAIFLLIAGTYTPLCVLALHGWLQAVLLAGVWAAAGVMVGIKHAYPGRFPALFGAAYIVLGWAAVLGSPQFVRNLPTASLVLAAIGGLLYTGGALILNRRWPDPNPLVFGYHEVWHVFMTSASACQYAAILLAVLALR
jgi:hemolysin III